MNIRDRAVMRRLLHSGPAAQLDALQALVEAAEVDVAAGIATPEQVAGVQDLRAQLDALLNPPAARQSARQAPPIPVPTPAAARAVRPAQLTADVEPIEVVVGEIVSETRAEKEQREAAEWIRFARMRGVHFGPDGNRL